MAEMSGSWRFGDGGVGEGDKSNDWTLVCMCMSRKGDLIEMD